ncbi:torsin-like protein [Phlebotomus argentipes]|uniref:torsin-like protein n=1 Tax=Phlebotomus argentipes TaxID=94469 RepID=UPI0028931F32|nr:torsin-like protein [Phlebotomus argentipes]
MKSFWVILFCFLATCVRNVVLLEPLTTLAVVGGGSAMLTALGINYSTIKLNTYCRWYECCTPDYIPANIIKFRQDLEKAVFGQHIAIKIVTNALQYHFENLSKSSKPLVMSFQGTPGIGKTYITNVMKDAIFKLGKDSKYVHFFRGRSSFPNQKKIDEYKEQLIDTVQASLARCPMSLFIFDEVDHMPVGVMEGITPLLDHPSGDQIDSSKAIFIFISNAGGLEISQQLASLMNRGHSREETELHLFEKITEMSLYNSNGALMKSGSIEKALIDHFIPFLPLEQRHVKKCIEAEFARVGLPNPTSEQINDVLKDVTYEKEQSFFATHGCKKLEKKVGLVAQMATISHDIFSDL